MFDSAAVDVAFGLILFFLFLSLVCSAVQEWIASAVGLRSRNLRKGIENLIGTDIAKSLYNHGQFKSLYKQPGALGSLKKIGSGRGVGPSYLEPKQFANILIDVIDRCGDQAGSARKDATAKTFDEIEELLKEIKQDDVRDALLSLLASAQGQVEAFRTNLADWFDSAMDRVSGWYARTVKVWLFVIAAAVVLALNANAIEVGKKLWSDQALRSALAGIAEQTAQMEGPPTYKEIKDDLQKFPIGWKCEDGETANGANDGSFFSDLCVGDKLGHIQSYIGWLITIIACSFGAPFWFGLLNKVAALRGSGKAPVKPDKDKSKATP
ncbi:MAG: hypothetical protein IIA68_12075 [Proteobacteria bacterium]|nr:hypothetical protein [Pseudomonadota bacterium]